MPVQFNEFINYEAPFYYYSVFYISENRFIDILKKIHFYVKKSIPFLVVKNSFFDIKIYILLYQIIDFLISRNRIDFLISGDGD